MNIDKGKLKALAEAAGSEDWYCTVHDDCEYVEGPKGFVAAFDTIEGGRYMAAASPSTILSLLAEIDRLTEEVALDDKIIAEREKLLDAIPECAAHGKCVPYAIQWVKDAQAELAELREVNGNLKIESEALRKDAERYRFIRNDNSVGKIDFCITRKHWSTPHLSAVVCLESADEQIDVAMDMAEDSGHG